MKTLIHRRKDELLLHRSPSFPPHLSPSLSLAPTHPAGGIQLAEMTNRNFPEHRSIQSGSDESGEHEFVLSNRADWPERHCDRLGAAEVVSVHTREGRTAALSRVIRRISQLCIALRLHTFGQVAPDERAQTRGAEPRRMCAGRESTKRRWEGSE